MEDRWLMMCIQEGALLEKKDGLKIGRETHLNINYLSSKSAAENWQMNCRILGIQGAREVSHHLAIRVRRMSQSD